MYSLNASVPGEAKRLAADLFPRLVAFDRVRDEHTLLVKRFEPSRSTKSGRNDRNDRNDRNGRDDHELATIRERVRPALAGTERFRVRITGIDRFEQPTRGPGPVLYFAIESQGLDRVHERLVAEFGAVADLEGDAYTPHVTLARGGAIEAARALVGAIDPIEWTVSELRFFDPRVRETVGRVSLPA